MKPFRDLKDLPNADGFSFVGVLLDGSMRDCVVKLSPMGTFTAYWRGTDEPCFRHLCAWIRDVLEAVK